MGWGGWRARACLTTAREATTATHTDRHSRLKMLTPHTPTYPSQPHPVLTSHHPHTHAMKRAARSDQGRAQRWRERGARRRLADRQEASCHPQPCSSSHQEPQHHPHEEQVDARAASPALGRDGHEACACVAVGGTLTLQGKSSWGAVAAQVDGRDKEVSVCGLRRARSTHAQACREKWRSVSRKLEKFVDSLAEE